MPKTRPGYLRSQAAPTRTSGASDGNVYNVLRGLKDLLGIIRGMTPWRRGVTALPIHPRHASLERIAPCTSWRRASPGTEYGPHSLLGELFIKRMRAPAAINGHSSIQEAWHQTAYWHVRGCLGRAVSPRRRVATQISAVIGSVATASPTHLDGSKAKPLQLETCPRRRVRPAAAEEPGQRRSGCGARPGPSATLRGRVPSQGGRSRTQKVRARVRVRVRVRVRDRKSGG